MFWIGFICGLLTGVVGVVILWMFFVGRRVEDDIEDPFNYF